MRTSLAIRRFAWVGGFVAALIAWAPPVLAEVKKIVIDTKVSPAFDGRSFGSAGQYETLTGHAFGELDPSDPHNRVITDIRLATRNGDGMVEYVASFFLVKPTDMSKSSHLLWHDVPNRGRRITIVEVERRSGDVGLSSGWQGDSSGNTVPGDNNDYVIVPAARNLDGSLVTGSVLGRIVNASGPDSRPMLVNANPVPYTPNSLETTNATLTTHASETIEGTIGETSVIPSRDWAWATCSESNPFPGMPDPTQICLRNGFDAGLLYQVVFTAQDPPVLGIGFAAFRDVASFFRNATGDEDGTPNPLANQITRVISRGRSQSGGFVRAFLQLGFNQDEAGRQVYDGMWPIIAGRRVSLNARFAQPDGALKLYEAGSEGPQWWSPWADTVRSLPAAGILDRCTVNQTCPKIIEHFGAAEAWSLLLSPGLVGTTANRDIPLPSNVRRYYIPSTRHGGGRGGFSVTPLDAPTCPGPNFGGGTFPANPVPQTETVNALRFHFRNWVMHGTPPPPSRYPTIADRNLVDPTKAAMGFPTIPGVPPGVPTGMINPMLDYDWGPDFNYIDGSGVPSNIPPVVKQVIRMKVARVDADGNELGGVPVVLRDAPLGTYLGWNVVADGFHKGKICNYAGGMIPFAETKAERLATSDPRPSLEERYRNHDGYVEAVEAAAAQAVAQDFLLQADADALVAQAEASNVLNATEAPASLSQSSQPREVPTFQVDPAWPRIPNRWKFGQVASVAVDTLDHVWVLQRPGTLSPEEQERAAPPLLEFDPEGSLVQAWGGPGEGYEWPSSEHGVYVDASGSVWIGGNGENDHQILKFTRGGKFVMQIGRAGQSHGNGDTGNLNQPADMFVHAETNELFVADGYGNRRVIVFDADTGSFKRMWGAFGNVPSDAAPDPALADADERGAPQFVQPVHAVRVSGDGLVYVSDRAGKRVQVFRLDGTYVKQVFIGRECTAPECGNGSTAASTAFSADAEQRFLYVGNRSQAKVMVFDRTTLELLDEFGTWGSAPGEFGTLHHMASDSQGNLYVTEVTPLEPENRRVQKFMFQRAN